jgi:hypothetical protein
MARLKEADPVARDRFGRFGQPQQDAALRYADAAERNLRKLRKALKKGSVSHSAEWLAAVQSDASRLATVLAFAKGDSNDATPPKPPARSPFDP